MFVTDPALAAGVVGQNAVVVPPDQSALLSLVYLPSSLVRIGLADRSVQRVTIDGPFRDAARGRRRDDARQRQRVGGVHQQAGARHPDGSRLGDGAVNDRGCPQRDDRRGEHPGGGLYLLNGQAVRFALSQMADPFALARFEGEL